MHQRLVGGGNIHGGEWADGVVARTWRSAVHCYLLVYLLEQDAADQGVLFSTKLIPSIRCRSSHILCSRRRGRTENHVQPSRKELKLKLKVYCQGVIEAWRVVALPTLFSCPKWRIHNKRRRSLHGCVSVRSYSARNSPQDPCSQAIPKSVLFPLLISQSTAHGHISDLILTTASAYW